MTKWMVMVGVTTFTFFYEKKMVAFLLSTLLYQLIFISTFWVDGDHEPLLHWVALLVENDI